MAHRIGDDPAYPTDHVVNAQRRSGLTKRELFAGMAMQAVLTAHYTVSTPRGARVATREEIAQISVAHAEALLTELEKGSLK